MWKLVTFMLALSAMIFLGYRAMYGRPTAAANGGPPVPTRQLENVRNAAKNVEDNQDKRLDETEKKAAGAE